MKRLTPFFISIRNNLTAFGLFLVLWFASALFFPEYIIPSPFTVLPNAASYLAPEFVTHLSLTLYRVAAGFVFAFLGGTLFGIIATALHKAQHLTTLMMLFQVMPGAVLGIIFLLLFGVGSGVPIALVAFLVLPMVAMNTSAGLAKKHRLLEDCVRNFGGTRRHLMAHIYFPRLIPSFQGTLALGFSLSIKIVILGEFIGSQDGIGYLLNRSKIYFRMDEVFFYLFIILLLMLCFQIIQNLLFSMLLGKYFYPD